MSIKEYGQKDKYDLSECLNLIYGFEFYKWFLISRRQIIALSQPMHA